MKRQRKKLLPGENLGELFYCVRFPQEHFGRLGQRRSPPAGPSAAARGIATAMASDVARRIATACAVAGRIATASHVGRHKCIEPERVLDVVTLDGSVRRHRQAVTRQVIMPHDATARHTIPARSVVLRSLAIRSRHRETGSCQDGALQGLAGAEPVKKLVVPG